MKYLWQEYYIWMCFKIIKEEKVSGLGCSTLDESIIVEVG